MTHSTEQLAQLVDRKRLVLAELCELGRRQLELIGRDEMAELLSVLWSKQERINVLYELERSLDPFRNQLPEERHWRSAEDRRRCAAVLGQCESLLQEILRQERLSEEQLLKLRDASAARLDGAHAAGIARNAYLAQREAVASQLDLSSQE